jgi:hypothetical protein
MVAAWTGWAGRLCAVAVALAGLFGVVALPGPAWGTELVVAQPTAIDLAPAPDSGVPGATISLGKSFLGTCASAGRPPVTMTVAWGSSATPRSVPYGATITDRW